MNRLESMLYHHVSRDSDGKRVNKDHALWALRARIAEVNKSLSSSHDFFNELVGARRDALICVAFYNKEIQEDLCITLTGKDYNEAAKIIKKDKSLDDRLSCMVKTGIYCEQSGCNC